MKKSIFLFFAAILCATSAWAAVTFTEEAVIYFTMENDDSNWWNNSGCYHYATFKGASGTTNATVHLYNIDDRDNSASAQTNPVFFATIPAGTYSKISFYRGKTAATLSSYHNAATDKVDLQSDKNKFGTIYNGDFGNWQSWSKTQETSTVALSASSNNVNENDVVTLTPSLTTNADLNKIKSVSYSIAPNSGASIDGNEFKATAAGTYTVTATITYNAKGFVDITKTTTATTTISVKSAAEETHDVTISYLCGSTKVADPTTVNTVGVETSVKITAPEIAKYTFANWTLGADVATIDALTSNEINITTKAGGSDFTLVANYEKAKLTYTVTVPAGTENCYLVGAMNGWDVENPIEMTKQGENVFTTTLEGVATTDEYKYISQKGSWDYADVQESNRTWSANDVVTAWKDPLATNVHLAGTMTDWDNNKIEFKKATKGATTASIILNLTAGDYKFKIVDNGSWLGNNTTINKTISGWTFAGDKGDCPLKATIAGDYTFTWAISTKKLSVTYPTICAITATANDAAMGTITGAGEYGKGSTATLTATPNDGYLFVNWTKGSEEVSTDATYSFKVEEAVELVANFEAAPEEVHNVTVSYVCGGNKIADDQTVAAVGETSAKTAEAPEIWGYTFSSWTLGAGVTSNDALTSNAIDINIVAGGSDFTLTANYTEIPKVTIYFVNNKKWSKVYAYGWGGSVGETPAWPGAEITANKEVEQIAGFDVHSYSVVPGSYVNIKFTNNSGTESANFKWTDGKYYYMDAAADYAGGTAEEVEKALVDVYTIMGAGELGLSWDLAKTGNDMTKQADGTYTLVKEGLDLATTGTYEYKVVKNHSWDWSIPSGNTNQTLKVDKDGTYTVTFTLSADKKKLTADTVCTAEKEVILDCSVAGTINLVGGTADFTDKLTMTYDEGTKTYSKTFTALAAGNYQMKVVYGSDWLGYDKLTKPVPANVTEGDDKKIKFSLAEAGDVTVTYNVEKGIGIVGNFAVPETKYYIAGTQNLTGFDWQVDGLEIKKDGDVYKHTFSEMSAGTYEFKITDGTWDKQWGFSNLAKNYVGVEQGKDGEGNPNGNIKIVTKEAKNIIVIFDPANNKITLENWAEAAPTKCYLMGNGDWENGVEMTVNPNNENEFMLLNHHISAPFKFKLGNDWSDQVENYDFPGIKWENDNIELPEGIYDFYFKKDTKKAYIAAVYLRDVTNTWGTICLPHASTSFSGAKFYEVSSLDPTKGLWLDEIEAETQLVAGKPYVFEATAEQIKVTYTDTVVKNPVAGANGLTGTFTGIAADSVLVDNYIIAQDKVWVAGTGATLPANCAYINASLVPSKAQAVIPGRRRVCMGENATTGFDQIVAPAGQAVKVIENGQLIIIRDGVKYNVQGQVIR